MFTLKGLALLQEYHTASLRVVNDINIGTWLGVEPNALAVWRSPADESYLRAGVDNGQSKMTDDGSW